MNITPMRICLWVVCTIELGMFIAIVNILSIPLISWKMLLLFGYEFVLLVRSDLRRAVKQEKSEVEEWKKRHQEKLTSK